MDDEDDTAGRNVIAWFEIPIRRINEAKTFYENVFGFTIALSTVNNRMYGIVTGGVTNPNDKYGAFVEYLPHEQLPCSSIHYFEASNQLSFDNIISKVIQQRGSIVSQVPHPVLNTSCAICTDNQGTQFGVILN